MQNEFYTSRQAAALLGLHVKTITRWCRSGKLPGARLSMGNRKLGWRIPISPVEVLLQWEEAILPEGSMHMPPSSPDREARDGTGG